jgi:hemerythrin superfamily protein
MDAIELLIADHRKVDGIFQQFERGGNTQEFEQLFVQLKEELTIHTQIEEEIFYPAVRNNQDTASLVEEAYQEHAQVKQLLQHSSTLDNTSTEWGQEMTEMMRDVQHHVQEEETELFPKVRQHFNEETLQQLGLQLQQRKAELKGQMGGATATASEFSQPQTTGSASSGQFGALDATTDTSHASSQNM